MSYDISVRNRYGVEVGDVNITYNVAPMFSLAFKDRLGIKLIDGIKNREALPLVMNAYNEMINNKDTYIDLNPTNGWGSLEETLIALEDIMFALAMSVDGDTVVF